MSFGTLLLALAPVATGTTALEVWLTALADEDPRVVLAGIEAAGQSHSPLFVDPLRSHARSEYPTMREAAVLALGELGVPRDPRDLLALLSTLTTATDDPEPAVRAAAIRALGRYPFPDAERRLLALADDQRKQPEQTWAAKVLAERDPNEAKARLLAYLALSQREVERRKQGRAMDPAERYAAGPNPILLFGRLLLAPEPAKHPEAIAALGTQPLEKVQAFMGYGLRHPQANVRRRAAARLAQDGGDRAASSLRAVLNDVDLEVRRSALLAQGKSPGPEATRALLRRLGEEPSSSLQLVLATALAAQPDALIVAALAQTPLPTNPTAFRGLLRRIAALSGEPGGAELAKLLVAAPDHRTQTEVQANLQNRPDAEVVPGLLRALLESPTNSSARGSLLLALEHRSDPAIAPALTQLLVDGNGDDVVATALQPRLDPGALAQLLPVANAYSADERGPALLAIFEQRSPAVARAAAQALLLAPEDPRALGLLRRQRLEDRLDPVLELLGQAQTQPRHGQLLELLQGAVDPRIGELGVVVVATQPELAPQVIDLILNQEEPGASWALSRLARVPAIAPEHRAWAVRQISGARGIDREELLLPLAGADDPEVKLSARKALHLLAPEVYPDWDPYGRAPLVLESAALGGAMMILANEIAGADLSPVFTGGVGLLLGGATPFLLTLDEDVTLGEAAYFGTYGLWGTLAGVGLGQRFFERRQDRLFATLGGEALGVAVGALSMRAAGWGPSDAVLANTTALETALITGGLTALIAKNDAERGERTLHYALVGGAAATLPMTFLARRLSLADHQSLMLATSLHGALLGAFLPGLIAEGPIEGTDVVAGVAAGQGLGYLVGLTWAQLGPGPDDAQLLRSGLGAGWGLVTAGGLAMLLDDRQAQAGVVQAGVLAGTLTLGLLSPELSGHDPAIALLMAASGALAAADLSVRIAEDDLDAKEVGGRAMLGSGLGLGAGLVLTQLIDLSDRSFYGTLGGGLLFGAGGVGFGYLWPDLDVRTQSRITGVSLLTGVALTLPFAEGLDLSGTSLFYAGLSGATLGLVGGLIPNLDTPLGEEINRTRSLGGITFGASLGLAGGLALAQNLDLHPGQIGIIGGGTLATAGIGAGLGLLTESTRPTTSGLLGGGAILGLAGGTLILQSGLLDSGDGPDRSFEVGSHTAAFLAQGALQGSLLPGIWEKTPSRDQVAGGAMLGAGAGALLGLTVAQLVETPLQVPDLVEASLHTGLLLGASGSLVALGVDRRFASQLAEGLGLLGYLGAYTLAPHTQYQLTDLPTLALGAGTFGAFGYLTPLSLGAEADDPQRAGAAGFGASVGALGASLYTQLRPERDDTFLGAALIAGAGIGGGLGLLLPPDDQRAALLTQLGLAAGLGVGLSLAPGEGFSGSDHALTTTLTLQGAWLGYHLPALAESTEDRRRGGGTALGAGLGLALGLGLGPWVEMEPMDVAELAVFSGLGSSLGGGLRLALPGGKNTAWAVELSGVLGSVLGAAVSPYTEYTMEDLSAATLTGGAGAYAGAFLPLLFGEADRSKQVGGAVAGGSLGLMAGLLLTELRPLDLGAQLETGAGAIAGGALGHGLGMLRPGLDPRTRGLLGASISLGSYGLISALSPYTEYDEGDRILVPLGGALGTSFGLALPILLGRDPDAVTEEERSGGILVGAGAGTLAMGALAQVVDLEPIQVGGGALAAGVGHGLGYGLGLLWPDSSSRDRLALMSGAGALGLGVGLLLAPSLELNSDSAVSLGMGGALGAAWALPMASYFGDGTTRRYGGAALFGASTGVIGGLLLDQTLHPSSDTWLEAGLGAGLGGLTGAGLGLIASTDDRIAAGLFQGLSAAGALSLATLLPTPPDHDLGDLALGTAYVGYLSWHALGVSLLTDGTDRQAAGLVLSTVGLGALTGRYLTPYLNLELEDVLMLLAGNMWGTWIGGWGGQVLKDRFLELDEGRQGAGLTLLSSAVGSDVGLAATALVVSGLLDVEPTRFAVINLAGLTGMMTGMLLASATESEPLKVGNVVGSLSGLVLGAVVTSFFDFSRTPTWDELLGKGQKTDVAQVAPPAAPTGMPSIESWFPSAQVQASPEGDPQYLLTVQGLW
ncbi:MAG: HEAT repeat domain-containing protein [Deltaproteobacteria bacterium]|nr:HEAT repeat domain-containing protein [Deltaproteobacteria bacterium]